ncbi:alpha-catulin isoform X1 [Musca domestica]|uniref:Alpha-catulin isoform X1 n=1 Tax=Musca domestica TaxID=7370 RepID=A0ABM3V8U7_MUSDO|nr:alpha-catulin isoform X1 [Musca domestica]XP_058982210.1 alpha-catulin isoform X1 [Musca domestica]
MISANNLEPLAAPRHLEMSGEQKLMAYKRVGQAVNMSVDRLVTIGEIIAEGFQDIKGDMFECCKDARDTGKSIEQLCISGDLIHDSAGVPKPYVDHTAIVLASRSLLTSITRVLLLVDIIVVKQLFSFKYKDSKCPQNLECVMNFTKFVQAFSAFGTEMVEMTYLTGSNANCAKEERRRSEILSARQVLEHSVKVLITSSKVCMVHYNCVIARENRNTVFCQIRRGMDHIHFIIKDTIIESEWHSTKQQQYSYYNNDDRGTIHATIQHFTYLMQCCRYKTNKHGGGDPYLNSKFNHNSSYRKKALERRWVAPHDNKTKTKLYDATGLPEGERLLNECYGLDEYSSSASGSPKYKTTINQSCVCEDLIEKLLISFDRILENIHDFTDSPYTSHEMRESILIYCDHCTRELNKYLRIVVKQGDQPYAKDPYQDEYIDTVLSAVKTLSEQLVASAAEQSRDMFHALKMSTELVNSLNAIISQQNLPQFTQKVNEFHEHCDHILDVCKLLRHIAVQDALKEQASHVSINLRIYGPQVILAAKILTKFPLSNVASENFDAFVEMWTWLVSEVNIVAKKILESMAVISEQDLKYLTFGSSTASVSDVAKPAKSVNFPKDLPEPSKELDLEADAVKRDLQPRWNEDLCDNDIIKRAKNLSAMAFLMYQFTKGNGSLKTTQDLFTQAEYFAEEANRLYKILRQFSYQVPASPHKKDLLNVLDRVPTFVQTLQFTVKDHTVGPSATYVKVDHVIRETKNLMCVINSVVTKCLECATKYNLDFNSITGGLTSSMHGDDLAAGAMDSKGTSNSSDITG